MFIEKPQLVQDTSEESSTSFTHNKRHHNRAASILKDRNTRAQDLTKLKQFAARFAKIVPRPSPQC
jgi:hypothetical protein